MLLEPRPSVPSRVQSRSICMTPSNRGTCECPSTTEAQHSLFTHMVRSQLALKPTKDRRNSSSIWLRTRDSRLPSERRNLVESHDAHQYVEACRNSSLIRRLIPQ